MVAPEQPPVFKPISNASPGPSTFANCFVAAGVIVIVLQEHTYVILNSDPRHLAVLGGMGGPCCSGFPQSAP
jgi:hypothetical protein